MSDPRWEENKALTARIAELERELAAERQNMNQLDYLAGTVEVLEKELAAEREKVRYAESGYQQIADTLNGVISSSDGRIAELEADVERERACCEEVRTMLAAEREKVARLEDTIRRLSEPTEEVHRLRGALVKRGLSSAPCDICGYDGPGYYQPDKHPCAALAATSEVEP